jgi:CMP-N,N'-diacetyllegionaminic acid synthase
MINGRKVIAIIPARSGSKGLPGKNTKDLCGKPLLAWSIESALESDYIDTIVVSTNSPDIMKVGLDFGAEVPFLRPEELATDEALTFDVIKHSLEYYKTRFEEDFFYTVLLEPTSPLRSAEDIDRAMLELTQNPCATSIVGISRTESQNPSFLVKISEGGIINKFDGLELVFKRRQDIEDVYFLEGSVYISETEALLNNRGFYHNQTSGCIFPKWKSLEIDDADDFIMVEALMRKKIGIK